MSWHFSRALGAAYSAARCSDGGPSALSSSTPTPEPSSPNGKTTAASLLSRSGTTSGPLTDGRGEELLTWFREASRARTSASLAKVPASAERAADCGARCGASWAKYDPATSSWRTHQRSLLGDWEPCSEIWPRWGMMLAGECWELSTPVRRIAGTASGLWQTTVADDAVERAAGKWNSRGEPKLSAQVMLPTPTTVDSGSRFNRSPSAGAALRPTLGAMARHQMWPTPLATDGSHGGPNQRGSKGDLRLSSAVRMWPTPCALEVEKDVENWARKRALPRSEKGGSHGPNLATAVKLFPTPTSQDAKNCTLPPSQRERDSIPGMMLRTGAAPGGQLNPSWVEWLMGWPIGWTDCAPSATDKFRQWQRSHGVSCP